jgi:hypothetical protein
MQIRLSDVDRILIIDKINLGNKYRIDKNDVEINSK